MGHAPSSSRSDSRIPDERKQGEDAPVSRAAPQLSSDDIEEALRALGAAMDEAVDEGALSCGPFTLLEVLGEGGFGVVYAAVQEHPIPRRVAVKILRAGLATDDVLRRFALEERALARIDHPCVAGILEAGVAADGRPWFAMPLLDGDAITVTCAMEGASARERALLMAGVCDGVHAAHVQGIIHRDIKPSNIVVERRSDGALHPRVIDFGIAKAIDPNDEVGVTRTGQGRVAGTLAYMAPEQVDPKAPCADVRTDVYSLGVVLCELLSGQSAVASGPISRIEPLRLTTVEVRSDATHAKGEAQPRRGRLSRADAALVSDLDAIIARATMPEPERRYQSAEAMAADLRHALCYEPVTARAPGRWYTLTRRMRPYRGVLLAGGIGFVAVIVLAVLASLAALRATRGEQAATQREGQLRELNGLLRGMFARVDPVTARSQSPELLLSMLDSTARHVQGVAATMHPTVVADAAKTIGEAYLQVGEAERAEALADGLLLDLHARGIVEPSDELSLAVGSVTLLKGDAIVEMARARCGPGMARAEMAPAIALWRQAFITLRSLGLGESEVAVRATMRLWSARTGWKETDGEGESCQLQPWLDPRVAQFHPSEIERWRYEVRRTELGHFEWLLKEYPPVIRRFGAGFGIDHPEVLRGRTKEVRFMLGAAIASHLQDVKQVGVPYLRGKELQLHWERTLAQAEPVAADAERVLGATHATTMEARMWHMAAMGHVHGVEAAQPLHDRLRHDAESIEQVDPDLLRKIEITWRGVLQGPAAGVWWEPAP